MAVLTAQDVRETVASELTFTTLEGGDTFTFNVAAKQLLILRNDTGGDVAITMIGDEAASTFECTGYGENAVNAVAITVTDATTFTQYLNPVSNIVKGETTITGGAGLTAALINL